MTVGEPDECERRIVAAVLAGTPVDLRAGDPGQDDPAHGAAWDATRTVRAELLVELLTAEPDDGRPRPVRIRGARITGRLDLEACAIVRPLLLDGCHLEEPVRLDEATAPTIRLPGCHLPGLSAQQLHTTGNLELNDGFTAYGTVDLLGARIGGKLSLSGARLSDPGGRALNADRLTAGQGVFGRDGFTADGEVRLLGARIDGRLDLNGARLSNPGGTALQANGISVGDHMLCSDGFRAEGRLSLAGARLPHLDLSGAALSAPGGQALNGYGLIVDRDLLCHDGFTADGETCLAGAQVNGRIRFDAAALSHPGGQALQANAITVGQSLFCRDGFTAEGEVHLIGARIGGVCDFEGARLSNPGGRALYAVRLRVDGDLLCRNGFTAEGQVQLSGAVVGGQVELTGARLSNPGHQALDLGAATAAALLLLPSRPPDGIVNLTDARVGVFEDDLATWPATIRLRGFVYDTLANDGADVRERLRRLSRQPGGYTPRVYDQLASAYRRAGREEAARQVAIAKQWHRRTVLGPAGKLANWLLYLTVGYGYRTRLAAVWLAGLLAMGTWVFAQAHPRHMTRADPNGPAFHAAAYTLDVLLPIIDLGQQKAWQPHGAATYWSWALIAAGWVLTTAVVAGLTGVVKRD
ncbi:hypothetical protein SAMN04489712_111177 [Thermomonospora echinospora]|uniref:Membrane-associated oxidoreductase n=1 Tax=Thermomonospora echinospora TaxID=1992 RepID=A0A1H6CU58_9ACTN|nr:hypothetical protein [Thermomonospora echinospora]SEG76550.1 hypothetical protein SAMN04489712_111177 [Thermomonospora echinospora]